ncbi:unnamed protein product [Laminaria digitata]
MDYRIFNSDEIDHQQCYRLLIGSIVPRPIAWVSSMDEDGVPNLAPFSFFSIVSHYPPLVTITVGEKEKHHKDTSANIAATKGYVIHTVTEGWENQMNESSASLPRNVSEFEHIGIETEPSDLVDAPRIKGCPVAMECEYQQTLEFGDDWKTYVVIGKVLRWHVREDLMLDDKYVNPHLLKPIGRLGGPRYCHTDDIFEMQAPYVQPDVGHPNTGERN